MADMHEITRQKLEKYFDVTGRALKKAEANKAMDRKPVDIGSASADFLDMAQRYYSDAGHFEKKDDYINAFACLNYAHGWLDAGARLGLFDVHDSALFTVDDKENKTKKTRKLK